MRIRKINIRISHAVSLEHTSAEKETRGLPLTVRVAVLDTVPNLLVAVQLNIPESSGKTSAMTRVHIPS